MEREPVIIDKKRLDQYNKIRSNFLADMERNKITAFEAVSLIEHLKADLLVTAKGYILGDVKKAEVY